MTINWDAVGAIGEIIGAFAVVLSLAYLATQIRAQNRERRIASVHDLNESFRSAITSFQNPQLADVFCRARSGFNELDETERLQFISMVQNILRVWEDAYHQHCYGQLNERTWQAMLVQFSYYLSLPGVQRVWEIRKEAYSEDFRELVDQTPAREYESL